MDRQKDRLADRRQKAEGRADMLREQAAREFNMETQETCAKASIDLKF